MIVSESFVVADWSDPGTQARYLLVMTPRIHHLIEALHAGDRSDFERIFWSTTPSCLPEHSRPRLGFPGRAHVRRHRHVAT